MGAPIIDMFLGWCSPCPISEKCYCADEVHEVMPLGHWGTDSERGAGQGLVPAFTIWLCFLSSLPVDQGFPGSSTSWHTWKMGISGQASGPADRWLPGAEGLSVPPAVACSEQQAQPVWVLPAPATSP